MPSAERDIGRYLKRFLGRVTHVVADIAGARLSQRDELPKAPDGTYAFLEQVAQKFHDPLSDMGVLVNPQGQVLAIISKEETCRETGGSCMDLLLVYGRGRGSWKKATHVTQRDRVVNIGLHNPENVPEGTLQPTIEGMLQELKDLACTSSPPQIKHRVYPNTTHPRRSFLGIWGGIKNLVTVFINIRVTKFTFSCSRKK